jgi:hypothetical protein
MSSQVDQFVDLLREYRSKGPVGNPWRDWDRDNDTGKHAPRDRSNYLRAYLNARLNTAKALLIAEAAGYQGAKFSGIAMTCERTLLGYRGVSRVDYSTIRSSPSEQAAPTRQVNKLSSGEGFANQLRVTSGVEWLIDPDYRRKLCCGIFLHFIHTRRAD